MLFARVLFGARREQGRDGEKDGVRGAQATHVR